MAVNLETVYFIETINRLAKMSTVGYVDWNNLTGDEAEHFAGILYDSKNDNRIVLDFLIDECHHDIITYYDTNMPYCAKVKFSEDDTYGACVEITFAGTDEDDMFIVEKGKWYSI